MRCRYISFSCFRSTKQGMAATGAVILLVILCCVYGQDNNCDYYQDVQVGESYDIRSPNYPNNYSAGAQCRWIARCPTGYNCKLQCTQVIIPRTSDCSQDRLMISETGDLQLSAAQHHCGRDSVSATSIGQTISVGFTSAFDSPGGNFVCRVTAELASGASNSGDTCQCGWQVTNRIVGGSETAVNQYPFMVALVDLSLELIKCGGVIIDTNYVLTAGHCLVYLNNPANTAVVVGEHDISIGDSPYTQVYYVSNLIVHPSFNQSNYDYDMGIVVMQTPIAFSDMVGPACLPFKFQYANIDFAEHYATILGWGTQFVGGPTSKVLLQADVQVITNQACSAMVSVLTPRQLCTYTPGKDSCQDDSGGPLIYTDYASGRLFHIGIISNGILCAQAGQPGINTRVTSMLTWIEDNTPLANYCKIGVNTKSNHGTNVFIM